jgi:(2S)-methylsuccinyl-CoA dehydrogenase
MVETHQTAAHGVAWLATYTESISQMVKWAENLSQEEKFGQPEQLLLQIGVGEYLRQIVGGIMMSQGEIFRLNDIGLTSLDLSEFKTQAVLELSSKGNTQQARTLLVDIMQEHSANITVGDSGLDEDLEMIREQFRKFSIDRIEPYAHEWHLKDELIPLEVISELSELGVFGLTIPEEYGGLGLSKASMAVVSEELSRGYIGVGSLGTRT